MSLLGAGLEGRQAELLLTLVQLIPLLTCRRATVSAVFWKMCMKTL